MKTPQSVSIDWDEHSRNFRESLRELRENDNFLDVTIVCDDDIQIKAHKNILSVSSNFFRNILRKNPHPHPLIYLKGLNHSDLVDLVEFMYSGKVEIAQANLESFLASAQDLKVKGLFDMQNNSILDMAKGLNASKKKVDVDVDADGDLSYGNAEEIVMPSEDFDMNTSTTNEETLRINICLEESSRTFKSEGSTSVMRDSNPMGDFDTAEMMDINAKRVSLIEKKDKMWHCKVCGKITKQICAIKNHVETHIDGISVDCSVCGKSYRSKSVLSAHKSKCQRNKINDTI
jgi:hypothetical protein